MPALYLITGTAHEFTAFTVFPELSFDFILLSISLCIRFRFSPSSPGVLFLHLLLSQLLQAGTL